MCHVEELYSEKLLVLCYAGRETHLACCVLPSSNISIRDVFGLSPPLQPQTKPHNLSPPSLPTALEDIAHTCRTMCAFISFLQYDKEISVINTATAECSVPSKRRADLPLTAGEQLDVIDVTEGNAVICRNSEGRCKFAETF